MVSAEWSDLPAVISQSSDHGEFIDKHDLDYIDKCTVCTDIKYQTKLGGNSSR